MRVILKRGSSSSRTSAGSRRRNLPSAIRPNAYVPFLMSASVTAGADNSRNVRRLACIVVSPYTGSTRDVSASLKLVVACRTCRGASARRRTHKTYEGHARRSARCSARGAAPRKHLPPCPPTTGPDVRAFPTGQSNRTRARPHSGTTIKHSRGGRERQMSIERGRA